MPKLKLNERVVHFQDGQTVLDVARAAGVEIPTLCRLTGIEPLSSCYLCTVKVEGSKRLLPSCAMLARDGMDVRTDDQDVLSARRTAIDLLFSDHLGECLAPCELACPARWDIPAFMESLQHDDRSVAAGIARDGLVLPGVLAAVCPAPCQKACRRGQKDATVGIRALHGHLAGAAAQPVPGSDTGKRVAIVGAGPAGLAAAFALRRRGHAVMVFDARNRAGGTLLELDEQTLPKSLLTREVAAIANMGVEFRLRTRMGSGQGEVSLAELRHDFDALLLAFGAVAEPRGLREAGLTITDGRINADPAGLDTGVPGIFAAGEVIGSRSLAVRAIADGLAAAESIHQFLTGATTTYTGATATTIPQGWGRGAGQQRNEDVPNAPDGRTGSSCCDAAQTGGCRSGTQLCPTLRLGVVRYGPLAEYEQAMLFARAANEGAPVEPLADAAAAKAEAQRCLLCGCSDNTQCRLRQVGSRLGAKMSGHTGQRRAMIFDDSHRDIAYESHKCILCGACVRLAEQAACQTGQPPALTFIGRGFTARVGAPYDGKLADWLTDRTLALRCADTCPTSALHRRRYPRLPSGAGVPPASDG